MPAKEGTSLPYRRARTLLAEFLPLDDIPTVERARERTLCVGARLEKQAIVGRHSSRRRRDPSSIDGGHVRAARQYQGRSFEVLLAQVSNDEGQRTVHACNGDAVIAQSTQAVPLTTRVEQGRVPGGRAYRRTVHAEINGSTGPREQWVIHGAGHAWSGSSLAGSYTDPHGPDATHQARLSSCREDSGH